MKNAALQGRLPNRPLPRLLTVGIMAASGNSRPGQGRAEERRREVPGGTFSGLGSPTP